MAEADTQAIVIDNGSAMIRAGFAGDDAPRTVFPSILGRNTRNVTGLDKDVYVGDEAMAKCRVLALTHPVERGLVTQWDDMEKLWHHALYKKLRIAPEEHNVFLTEPPFNPKANRERMTEIMFETFGVRGMYATMQAVLPLFASGTTSGVVLDSGRDVSHVVPVYEGFALLNASRRLKLAGRDVTNYFATLCQGRGYVFTTAADLEQVREIKEALAYVAEDYEAEEKEAEVEERYELPDGVVLTLGDERFRCSEALFRPHLVGKKLEGVHTAIHESIQKCDMDLRRDLYGNVLLAGGSTLFPGFASRLTKELTALAPGSVKVRVVAPPERKYSAWIGGAIFASLSCFQDRWVSRSQYEESGPTIVHKKCF